MAEARTVNESECAEGRGVLKTIRLPTNAVRGRYARQARKGRPVGNVAKRHDDPERYRCIIGLSHIQATP